MTTVPEPANVIYGLHAGDGVIRYVGLTTKTARERMRTHRAAAKRGGQYPVYHWMRKHGLGSIERLVLEVVSLDGDLCGAEDRWIAHYSAIGDGLLNLTTGGDCTAALFWDEARRGQQGARRTGTVATAETRAKMAAARTGRKHGPESRAKMSASAKIASQSPARLDAAQRRREGLTHVPQAKITAADVVAIRLERAETGASYKSIGGAYGLSPENVSMICRRLSWKHVAA